MTTRSAEMSGWVIFATTVLAVMAVFKVIFGLTLIIDNEWLVFAAGELWYLDTAVWGWITLGVGVLLGFMAWGVASGQTWARILGIIVAGFAAVDAFLIAAYYPVWGLTLLGLAILVIWALAVHGDEVG